MYDINSMRLNKISYSILICSILLLSSSSAFGAGLYGQVLRKAPTETKKKIQRYKSRKAETEQVAGNCECNPGLFSVIYLTGENLPDIRPELKNQKMAQKDKTFEPSVMAVSLGSTVEFPNLDPFFHNVFSYSSTKKFDLGRYPEGKSKEVTFDKPGIVSIFCEIHYTMRAYVHVLETPYYTVSDKDGNFALQNIQPGNYTLHLWQENLPEITEEIDIVNDSTYMELR